MSIKMALIAIVVASSVRSFGDKSSTPVEPSFRKSYVSVGVNLTGGSFSTAIKTFESTGKPTVTLVADQHVARASYFDAQQRILLTKDIVLYEMPLKWTPKVHRDSCDDLLILHGMHGSLPYGLEAQWSYTNYLQPHFRRADLIKPEILAKLPDYFRDFSSPGVCKTVLENLMSLTPHCKGHATPFACHVQSLLTKELTRYDLVGNSKEIFANEGRRAMLHAVFKKQKKIEDGTFANEDYHFDREAHVQEMVRHIFAKEPKTKTLAILFGAAHMPRFEEFLVKEFGYRLVKEEWIEAFDYLENSQLRSDEGL